MPEFGSFDEVSQEALSYFDDEATLQKAYDLLTEAALHFPKQAAITYNWRYCAAALMNKTDLALSLFQESLDAGFWWSAAYLTSDDDLKSLQDLPEFKRLTEISEQKYQAAQKDSKPLALPLSLPENVDGATKGFHVDPRTPGSHLESHLLLVETRETPLSGWLGLNSGKIHFDVAGKGNSLYAGVHG